MANASSPPPLWPELMRPDTLAAYLDCRSPSDFARKMRVLEDRGYPGMDPDLHRHVKAVVDRYLTRDGAQDDRRKARMLEAARGGQAA